MCNTRKIAGATSNLRSLALVLLLTRLLRAACGGLVIVGSVALVRHLVGVVCCVGFFCFGIRVTIGLTIYIRRNYYVFT